MPLAVMGTFADIMNFFPFVHTVSIATGVFVGDYACIFPNLAWIVGYTALAVLVIWLICRKKY